MAVRPIVLYFSTPEILRQKSEPVRVGLDSVRHLIADLKDTLLSKSNGIGLCAPQIAVHKRVIVVRFGAVDKGELGPPVAIVNPVIVEADRYLPDFDGCLSFPGLYAETVRPHFILLQGLNEHNKSFEWTITGFDAVVVHHEIDHLDGILFIDRVDGPEQLYTEPQVQRRKDR